MAFKQLNNKLITPIFKTIAEIFVVVENDQLMFAVREPFQSIKTQTGIVSGVFHNDYQLIIESLMPNYGVIFSDGIERDFLKFNSGAIATIGLAKKTAKLVVN